MLLWKSRYNLCYFENLKLQKTYIVWIFRQIISCCWLTIGLFWWQVMFMLTPSVQQHVDSLHQRILHHPLATHLPVALMNFYTSKPINYFTSLCSPVQYNHLNSLWVLFVELNKLFVISPGSTCSLIISKVKPISRYCILIVSVYCTVCRYFYVLVTMPRVY